jgi:hypothetical protein
MLDNDQRFKLFFSEWAGRFDFEAVEWLDKEVFLDPPQGQRNYFVVSARANRTAGSP